MEDSLVLKNRLKEIRTEQKISQADLAKMVGVSRNTISSIETGQFSPTAKESGHAIRRDPIRLFRRWRKRRYAAVLPPPLTSVSIR